MSNPDLDLERSLAGDSLTVVGMDEVGRGALAGPVCVGAVAWQPSCAPPPTGIKDSKLLTAPARQALAPAIKHWAAGWGLGWASAADVDRLGLTAALRQAGLAALFELSFLEPATTVVLLDGKHNWLTQPDDLFATPGPQFRVVTQIKADRDCLTVASASVIAKVARDAYMTELSQRFSAYGWEKNKGYGSVLHLQAIASFGVTEQHRRSWALPGAEAQEP